MGGITLYLCFTGSVDTLAGIVSKPSQTSVVPIRLRKRRSRRRRKRKRRRRGSRRRRRRRRSEGRGGGRMTGKEAGVKRRMMGMRRD